MEELQNMHGLNQTQSAALADPLLSTQQGNKHFFTNRNIQLQHSYELLVFTSCRIFLRGVEISMCLHLTMLFHVQDRSHTIYKSP